MSVVGRVLLLMAAMHLSAGAGCAFAQAPSANRPVADPKLPGKPPARSREIYQSSPRFLAKKYAVAGYDAVAYFREQKAVEGKDAFMTRWKDATWRFSSKENLDAFVANPERYAPQYGGYCAYAVSQNELAPGNPRVWKIVNGKLYLNLNASAHSKWEREQAALIKSANAYWPDVLAKRRK
jgi:YHS domain-containing protein